MLAAWKSGPINQTNFQRLSALCLTEYIEEWNGPLIFGAIRLLYSLYGSAAHVDEFLRKHFARCRLFCVRWWWQSTLTNMTATAAIDADHGKNDCFDIAQIDVIQDGLVKEVQLEFLLAFHFQTQLKLVY